MDKFAKFMCINLFTVNTIMIVLNILLQTTDWKEALKLNIMAGGDSSGRGLFLGSCLGAIHGSIPSDLASKWTMMAEVQKSVDELC